MPRTPSPSMRKPASAVEIGLRVAAASLGAYALTYEATAALALLLPVDRLSAVLIATNLSFVLMTILVLWSFCCRGIVRLWSVMLGATVTLAIIVKVMGS